VIALIPVLQNITHSKSFLRGDAYPWQSHHVPSLAMSGGDGMDSTLEYILTDMHGFLLLRPFMPDA
jgi:hypothetical protein